MLKSSRYKLKMAQLDFTVGQANRAIKQQAQVPVIGVIVSETLRGHIFKHIANEPTACAIKVKIGDNVVIKLGRIHVPSPPI
jgi:hypothetical protein